MSITRKEFFRQALFSVGKTALDLTDTVRGTLPAFPPEEHGTHVPADPGPDMVAEPHNSRCLAANCGCFACVERCGSHAIILVPGVGIRVNANDCTGCGTCEYVCPVSPKAVVLVPRGQS
jgi:ferredoxin